MRFASKVDSWLIPLIVVAVGGALWALVAVLVEETPLWVRFVVASSMVLLCALLFSIFKSTYYVVDNGELRIVSGPFRWRIAIDDIQSIEPSRNPLSSPALSLDRLKISCGKYRFVLVSPADKDGFIKTIEREKQS